MVQIPNRSEVLRQLPIPATNGAGGDTGIDLDDTSLTLN
jgi:hypothetical protein